MTKSIDRYNLKPPIRWGGSPTLEQCVGKAILTARTERGMTREELAIAAGLDEESITRYERGERWTTPMDLLAIAEALDIQLRTLFSN